MPVITPRKTLTSYDVLIVGSGAGGGMAAGTLTQAGLRVLMLEAGRDYSPEKETPMFQRNDQAPLRGTATPDKHFGFFDATAGGGWTVPNEPCMVRREGAPSSRRFRSSAHDSTRKPRAPLLAAQIIARFSGPSPVSRSAPEELSRFVRLSARRTFVGLCSIVAELHGCFAAPNNAPLGRIQASYHAPHCAVSQSFPCICAVFWLGMSGTGMPVTMCDLLSQTELYFDYTVIIEEGLSYGIYTKTVDPNAEPIILQPDGSLTINYLGTSGLPITAGFTTCATGTAEGAAVAAVFWKRVLIDANRSTFRKLKNSSRSGGTTVRLWAMQFRSFSIGSARSFSFARKSTWASVLIGSAVMRQRTRRSRFR